ncbi:MAG: peptidoglycan-binding protein, partial [Mycobacteriales bacterium]
MRPRLLAAAVGVLALLALTGCTSGEQRVTAAAPDVVVEQPQAVSSPSVVEESPSAVPSVSPSPSPTRPPKPSYDVKAVQTQLAALHYYGGAIDGERGPALRSAVLAFQKVQNLG